MNVFSRIFKGWVSLLVAAVFLTGCLDSGGGGGTASTSISGTAATGAPLAGTVDLVDANGVAATPVTINSDGTFTITTTGLSAPFILRATGGNNNPGVILYSLADGVSGTFNITPLTHLAVEMYRRGVGVPPSDLDALFAAWNTQVDPADLATLQTALLQAQARINANLDAQFKAQNLTPTTFDFLRTGFSANHQGLDALLDGIHVSINANGISITAGAGAGTTTLPFNIDISINGYNIGGGAAGGSGGSTTCGNGGTMMTFSIGSPVNPPFLNKEQVCFTASTTSLAFSGKTLTNPQVGAPSGQYSIYTFTDGVAGKYEVVLTANNALYEINVLSSGGTYLGQFTPTVSASAGGPGSLTLAISISGVPTGVDINIQGVPKPATQNEFCTALADVNSSVSLNTALASAGGTFTVTGCTFSGSVGNVSANLAITNLGSFPYTVVYTYN